MSVRWAPLASLVAGAALVGLYVALGGASYQPLDVADPCTPRPAEQLAQREGLTERLALSALDGAACELRVPREDLVFALADPEQRALFISEHRITDEVLESALRAGLIRAVDDAARAGEISGFEETLIRAAAERVPIAELISALEAATGDDVLGLLDEVIAEVEG